MIASTPQELSVAASLTALGRGQGNLQASPAASSLNESLLPASTSAETFLLDPKTQCSDPNSGAPKTKLTFAQKLFEILEKPEHSHIIKWLPGGKSWIIMDKKSFTSEILPTYFKQSQFTSFTRKLSRWKFNRVSKGPYMGAYHHRFFRRDRKYLCILMSCKNEAPCLTTVAKVRQVAISKGDFGAASLAAADLVGPQKTALKSLEDMNKQMIKEKLLNIRLRKAQLYEENARMLLNARALAAMRQEIERNAPLQTMKTVPNGILRNGLTQNYNSVMLSMPKLPSRPELINQQPRIPQHQNLHLATHSNIAYPPMPSLQSLQHMIPLTQKQAAIEDYNNCFRASAA